MTNSFRQGYYVPRNPAKYLGNPSDIVYRSSWEEKAMRFFDNNPNVLRWSSEPLAIQYVKPTDGKIHRYFPDFWIEVKNANGVIIQELIEIKPEKETMLSKSRSKKGRLLENTTFAINAAKWTAASNWCKNHGIKFRILTEKDLFQ